MVCVSRNPENRSWVVFFTQSPYHQNLYHIPVKQQEIPVRALLYLLLGLGIRYILQGTATLAQFLTQYFPFSLIDTRFFYHYRNRNIIRVWDYLYDTALSLDSRLSMIAAQEDQYFVHLWVKFERGKTEKVIRKLREALVKKYGASHAYMDKEKGSTYHFKVAIEKVCEE